MRRRSKSASQWWQSALIIAAVCLVYVLSFEVASALLLPGEQTIEDEFGFYDQSNPTFHQRTLLASSSSHEEQAADVADSQMIKLKQEIYRRNFKWKPVPAKFEPESTDYWQSIILIGIPGFAIGIGTFVIFIFYIMFRFCCNCCGGRKARPEGYTFQKRLILKIILVVFALFTIAAVIVGWSYNAKLSSAIDKFFNIVIDTSDEISDTATEIIDLLHSLQVTTTPTEIEQAVIPVRDGADEFKKQVEEVKATVRKIDKWRMAAINVGYVVVAIAAVVGVLGAICNLSIACIVMMICGLLSLLFLWVSFGVHLPVSVLMADFCVAVDEFISSESNERNPELSQILQCLTNDTFDIANSVANNGVDKAIDMVNSTTMACCNISVTYENITTINITQYIPPENQATAQGAIHDFEVYQKLLAIIQDLSSCRMVREAYKELQYTVCVLMLKPIDVIAGTQGFIGCILIPGIIVAILGSKWLPHPYKGKDDGYDLEEYDDNSKHHHHSKHDEDKDGHHEDSKK